MRRLVDWLPVGLGIAILSALVAPQWHRIVRGQNDFVQLYCGAKLVGTAGLYSREANQALIKSLLGGTMESVMYTRPPFYAALLKPLAYLPYLTAFWIFFGLCVASLIWFVIRFSKECPALPVFAAFSIPVAAVLPQGQDTPLVLMLAAGSILATRRKRDFLAGALLSLCAIKFHLFLLVPVLLILKKRWRMVAGGAGGIAALSLIGATAGGLRAYADYVRVLRDPWINFRTDMMPNLHGLATTIASGSSVGPLELVLSGVVVAGFLWICLKSPDFEFLFAMSLLCGLLISYHSGLSDQILLLLVFALMIHACKDKSLRIAIAAPITPIPYLIGTGVSLVQPLLLLLILGLAAFSLVQQREPALAAA